MSWQHLRRPSIGYVTLFRTPILNVAEVCFYVTSGAAGILVFLDATIRSLLLLSCDLDLPSSFGMFRCFEAVPAR